MAKSGISHLLYKKHSIDGFIIVEYEEPKHGLKVICCTQLSAPPIAQPISSLSPA
jgi:hypothetical protein